MNVKLDLNFYLHHNVNEISKNLLGKFLLTNIKGQITGGMIVETEAYAGITDKASHAYNNRKTNRTKVLYENGGIAYIYLCYGIHYLFNVVTNTTEIPHAVLIRAVEPTDGIDLMCKRREQKYKLNLTNGPGSLTMALGINTSHSRMSLLESKIWIESRNINIKNNNIISSPRVGIDYAQEYIKKPWRYRIKNNPLCGSVK